MMLYGFLNYLRRFPDDLLLIAFPVAIPAPSEATRAAIFKFLFPSLLVTA